MELGSSIRTKSYRRCLTVGTRQQLAAWNCVHIPHTCVFHAVNRTFLNMMFENGVHSRPGCGFIALCPMMQTGISITSLPQLRNSTRNFCNSGVASTFQNPTTWVGCGASRDSMPVVILCHLEKTS